MCTTIVCTTLVCTTLVCKTLVCKTLVCKTLVWADYLGLSHAIAGCLSCCATLEIISLAPCSMAFPTCI